jgi:hypothetical protein
MYQLTTMWRGLPSGTPIDAFPSGMIDVLMQRGIAIKVEADGSNNATTDNASQQNSVNRTSNLRSRSQEASAHRAN